MPIGNLYERDMAACKRDTPVASPARASNALLSLTLIVPLLMPLLFWPQVSHGADTERGQLLYENHCVACHDSRAHIRSDRRAKTLTDVRQWVNRWSTTLALGWGESERDDVANFLFDRYYSAN